MINNEKIAQIQQMAQQGVQLKNIMLSLKNQGFTPQVVEQMLFMAFPKLKQTQTMITNSGMSMQEYINQLAKQQNIPINEVNSAMENMRKMFN